MPSRQNTPLGLKRSRPTDATGLFWAFVSLVVGVFMYLTGISPHVFEIILIALIICISWQIRIWADHRAKLQVARAWCEQYYPIEDVTIILDFAFALALKMSSDLKNHTPATLIENVNWVTHDEWTEYYHPDYNSPTSVWLEEVLADARITDVHINHFEGDTLGDIFTFIIRASKNANVDICMNGKSCTIRLGKMCMRIFYADRIAAMFPISRSDSGSEERIFSI